MEFGLIDVHSESDEDKPSKKVDKLGRVRPKSYASKENTQRKKRQCREENMHNDSSDSGTRRRSSEIEAPCASDDFDHIGSAYIHDVETDQTEHFQTELTRSNNEVSEFKDMISNLLDVDVNIMNDMTENETNNIISDDKWEELMGNPVLLENAEESENESDTTKMTSDEGSMPIYPGHSMTVNTSMILILLYTIIHQSSGAELADLLSLVGVHCLQSHPGLKSIYLFQQHFAHIQSPLKKHYYCRGCMANVNQDDNRCATNNCNKNLKEAKNKNYFIEIPLDSQLENILKRPGTLSLLSERFARKKKNKHGIEDIYDGNVYQKLSAAGGPLSSDFPYNISFTWNTDGIPVFKSSKFSLWPFYIIINELPYKQRMLKENMILCGLWFGETKPFMSLFTKPIMNSLKHLETEGITYEIGAKQYTTKGFLICGTADLPAKSLVLNCNQFNGQYSCMRCMQPGETYKTQKGGCVHTFLYDASKPAFPDRTFENCVQDAISAVEKKQTVNGIKGPSFLMTLQSYDFIKSNSIDYMHGVLLGITKLLIKLWISSPFSDQKFSVSKYVDVIDERLTQIKPPAFITRIPRSLADHFKYWKASELRSWLFYYSLPIMSDILQKEYFLHYACFVQSIYLLSTDSIGPEDLHRSQKLLSYFVHMFPALYGQRFVTLNMHSLLHLVQCVQDLGPLWVYSCFPFENINGVLMELFHGTQNVELQIISSLNILQNLPEMLASLDTEEPTVVKFLSKIHGHKDISKQKSIDTGTSSGSYPIGASSNVILTQELYGKLITEVNFQPQKLYSFKRISHRGSVIHSATYTRVHVRNTFTVKYYDSSSKSMSYGSIEYFVLAKKCVCCQTLCKCEAVLVAVVNRFCDVKPSIVDANFLAVDVPHIKVVKKCNILSIIDVTKILSVVVNVQYGNDSIFLCEVPNFLESD